MRETPILSRRRGLTILFLAVIAASFCSCATEKQPRTALISDPDSQNESSIPWNRPQKWESGSQVPGGFGQVPGTADDPMSGY
jgi:hypothetical protein